ncbi:PAS domain S-box protein [bacterium]|nr:PAS domain S-box protein [bacterium]
MKSKAPNSEVKSTTASRTSTESPGAKNTRSNDSSSRARGLAGFLDTILTSTRRNSKSVKQQHDLAQEAEAPELLDLLLEGPDALVVVYQDDGEIIEASERFIEWSGFSREDLAGSRLLDLFPEHERKVVRTLYEDAGAGGVHVVELPFQDKSKHSRLVEFTSARSQSGNGEFALLVGRDVGERAATERYLRAERDRLNKFIHAMRDGLILLSGTGDVLYSNPAMDQMFEPYSLPVVCHRWLKEFSAEDSTDLQGLTSAYGGKTLTLESGDGRYFLVTRSFLFEARNRAMVMLMAKDISEQVVMERQNRQLEIELMRESKLSEFGMLSAGIAHNLNGPLTGILGLCDLVQLRGEESKEVTQIRQQAQAMREIIANLMIKSRSEREMEPRDLLIEDIILTELRFLEANLFFKSKVERKLELAEDSPAIYGVYIHLSQVVGNLLRNAIDAMYKTPKKVLTVKTWADEKYLYASVGDTGTGIPEEVRDKIFQAFFTTKPKSSEAKSGEPTGTGLGLSTSRNMLARYGAELQLESEVGVGTTFTIRFPLGRKPKLEERE